MCVTIEDIWNLECEHSPVMDYGKRIGYERQVIKAVEEIGEFCAAYLKGDIKNEKEELADSLNTLFGLSLMVYKSPEELATSLMNAIEKMAEKYGNVD